MDKVNMATHQFDKRRLGLLPGIIAQQLLVSLAVHSPRVPVTAKIGQLFAGAGKEPATLDHPRRTCWKAISCSWRQWRRAGELTDSTGPAHLLGAHPPGGLRRCLIGRRRLAGGNVPHRSIAEKLGRSNKECCRELLDDGGHGAIARKNRVPDGEKKFVTGINTLAVSKVAYVNSDHGMPVPMISSGRTTVPWSHLDKSWISNRFR